ncbi:hypothetical protein C8R46DRAFT_938886 [Mycena filopes]|nr:hypothetical protein C8R46DRAFT_938886 [Mycena filopes]
MEALPVELHSKIYRLACKDDGTTGRALSRVSTRINAVSAPYRYQSLVVCGPTQLQKLVDRLRAVPRELRRIRYLFVYDQSALRDRPAPRASVFLQDARKEAKADEEELRTWVYPADLASNLVEILSMAQETVEILSVVSVKEGSEGPLLFQGSFPALEHLTIRGPHPIPTSPTFAPLLTTLHLTGDALPRRFADTLAQNHPALSRLRLSRFNINRRISEALQIAGVMGITASTQTTATPPPPRLPLGVERLLLLEPSTQTEFRNFDPRIRLLPLYQEYGKTAYARVALREWGFCLRGEPMPWGAGEPAWDVVEPLVEQAALEPQRYSAISIMEMPFHYHTRPDDMPIIVMLFPY